MTDPRRGAVGRRALAAFLALGLLAAAGCGPPKFYPVKGRVIFSDNLRPLTEGEVRFQPVSRPQLVASGTVNPDGSFSLSTPSHPEGVLQGQCRVAVVVEPRDGRPIVQDRFQHFDTSDIRVTVTDREENYFIIEVGRPDRVKPRN